MFWSQPNPCANTIGCPSALPLTRTLFLATATMPAMITTGAQLRPGVIRPLS